MPHWMTRWLPRRILAIPFRTMLNGGLAVLLGLVWLAGAVQLWLERNSYIDLAETAAENVSIALAEYTHQTLRSIDNRMVDVAMLARNWTGEEGRAAARTHLSTLAGDERNVRSMHIYDNAGRLVVSSDDVEADFPDIRGREDFLAQRAGTTGVLLIGVPQRTARGEWRFPLSRRIGGTRGEFAGVVVANLNAARLQRFFATLDVGKDGLVNLLHRDAMLLVRHPPLDSSIGPLPANALIPVLARRSPHGAFTFSSVLDQIQRIGYYRTLSDYPVIVTVAISMDDALQPWRRLVLQFVGMLAGVSIAVFLLGWAISRQHALWERAEAQARERQQQLEGIAGNMPAVAFQRVRHADGASHYTFVNPRIREVFGLEPEQVMSGISALQAITHPDDVERIQQTYEESARTLSVWKQEFRLIVPGKGLQWLQGAATPRRGPGGDVIWDGVYFNITAERLAEEQLQHSHRMETIGQLARGVAHQFNNLLMSIQGHLELIQLDHAADHPAARSAGVALDAVQRGAALTRQLLAFSRRQQLEPTVFDLNRALRDSAELLAGLLDKTIHLDLSLQADLPGVRVDRSQFQSAIVALALNAKEAMPKGGTIALSTGVAELGPAQAAAALVAPGRFVTVVVRDSGVGMSDSVQMRAFEPFFSTKGMGEGTGLGLSQVHGFMKQSGGHTALRSLPNQGTEVALYFPIQDGPAVDPQASEDAVGDSDRARLDSPRGVQ